MTCRCVVVLLCRGVKLVERDVLLLLLCCGVKLVERDVLLLLLCRGVKLVECDALLLLCRSVKLVVVVVVSWCEASRT